jgi:ribosomal protein S18 acetylase RimI-like enzyme
MTKKSEIHELDKQGNIIGRQSIQQDNLDKKTGYMSDLFVDEAHRKKGIGARLMQAAENMAKSLGLIKTKIEVDSENPAISMYLGRGYKEVGRKRAKNGKTYNGTSPLK